MQNSLLVINAGSSSVKFALFSLSTDSSLNYVARGQVENLDETPHFYVNDANDTKVHNESYSFKTRDLAHEQALAKILQWLRSNLPQYKLCAVGHRVVHGADRYLAPIRVDQQILQELERFIPLAPLHQPYNLAAIKAIFKDEPDLLQVACFDTAFHQTESNIAQAYALPEDISDLPIKRYGFHGLSYEYIASILPKYLGENAAEKRIIIAHLGHGASLCAIRKRQSIATTMGFTALEGLPMGTRCGSIDPGVLLYLLKEGMSVDELTDLLYSRSGLLGVSGISSDMRVLQKSADLKAKKAIDLLVYRIQREIGSLIAALSGLDSLVFTGGIGENSAEIRSKVCCLLGDWLGIKLDVAANAHNDFCISAPDSKVSVWTLPTNEELMIAQHTLQKIEYR
jgi:acetate kinase